MAPNPTPSQSGSRETLWAIIGSFVIAIVLATILTGNPWRSLSRAYHDYTVEPRGGGPANAPSPGNPATPK